MTPDREQLERELAQHLSETAQAPRHDASAGIRLRIAATPQRRGWLVRLGAMAGTPAWNRACALVAVAAAALVVGIYIGQVGLPIQLGPTGSPSGSPTADVSPVESGRPEPSAPASPPPGVAMSYAEWHRIDMPNPAPGVFGGGTPSSVVAFNGGYVAVGTIHTECCAEADPAANVGVVWTSTNGVDWQLVDAGDTFEHATLGQVVTDGERLIAIGSFAELVDGALSLPVGATWTSSDGITWQRSTGEAPSRVALISSGLIGVRAGNDGVAYFSSPNGATWTRHGTWPDIEEVLAVGASGDGAMVIGLRTGGQLADGTPTLDSVVWQTTDGSTWTGGSVVENARLRSVAPFAGGFVAVGSSTEVLAEGGEIAAISSVWTSQDGLTWTRLETDIGHPSENVLGVFPVGEALVVTVECCGGDLVLRPRAWVSEDGATWTPVPQQPAFEGTDIQILDVIETPDGLVAVGRRWDPESNHPLPQAWIASDDPMVWLEATSQPGAQVGNGMPFSMGHCGLRSPIDFDGSLWAPTDRDPMSLEFDSASGTITLLGADRARFVSDAGASVTLGRVEGAAAYPLCD